MTTKVGREIEAALASLAQKRVASPEELPLGALSEHDLDTKPKMDEPRDDWERRLRDIATDCGVSLSDWAVSREAMYD